MNNQNLAGQTIGQYELVELLGAGGMGAVYRAVQTSLGREVALKVLSAALVNEPGYLERFNREARVSAALEHDHIVPVYDFGAQQDLTYVVMRLLTGGSLDSRMRQRKHEKPSLSEAVSLLNAMASALDYAHSRGVIHRDIKPANIMFDQNGKPYLVDFGIAKILDATGAGLTGTGMAMGSPYYMPPEQWRGENATSASDQYALAVTVYSMLAGRPPFEATSTPALMYKHFHDQPEPLKNFRQDVPERLMPVLTQAMAKDASDRFRSVGEFAEAFQAAAGANLGEATGFFTFPVQRTPLPSARLTPTPTPGATPPGSGRTPLQTTPAGATPIPSGATPPPPTASGPVPKAPPPQRRGPLPYVLGGVVVIALLIVGAFALSGGGAVDRTPTPSPTTGAPLVADVTVTPEPTATDTLRPEDFARATRNAQLTIQAELTSLAVVDLTETASVWTATFTATYTPTYTASATATDTTTRTATSTATRTPTDTPTVTATATPSDTTTATPTNTATVTASRTPTATATSTASPTATATFTPSPRPTVVPAVARLFEENFSDGEADGITRRLGGRWEIRQIDGNNAYCNVGDSADDFDLIVFGEPTWDNYILQVDVRFMALSPRALVELYGRYEGGDTLNAYRAYLDLGGGGASLAYDAPERDLGGVAYTIGANRWYTLRLEMVGRRLRYAVNGQQLISNFDDSRSEGLAGVLVHRGTEACIDNLRVWLPTEPEDAIVVRVFSAADSINLQTGPGTTFTSAGRAESGDLLTAIGRDASGTWLQVRTRSGITAWIAATLVRPIGGVRVDLNDLPVTTP